MKSATSILDYVRESIHDIYVRPGMYADSASCVEAILNTYHDLWAMIVDREEDYIRAKATVHAEEYASADTFSNNYARLHPDSDFDAQVRYAVSRWQKIDEMLGI